MDLYKIYQFLDEAPDLINMTKIMPPYVFKYHGKVAEDWGISGFVLIAESHISLHTFPARQYLSLDVFSCKEFNVNDVTTLAVETFKISRIEPQLLNRGLEFPRNVRTVEKLLRQERSNM